MKTKNVLLVFWAMIFFASSPVLWAASKSKTVKSAGIGVRTTFWNFAHEGTWIHVENPGMRTEVNVGGAGGHLYLLSRLNETMWMELSLGGIGTVESKTSNYIEEKVDVSAITPLLLGLRFHLLPPTSQSGLKPYLSCGVGPYWLSDITIRDGLFEEEVRTTWTVTRGGYLGGGADFQLAGWFAVNFDARYHFIEFDVNHPYSDVEYGIGIQFMWGNYKL